MVTGKREGRLLRREKKTKEKEKDLERRGTKKI